MRTPLQAMIWELWRTGRLEILARLVCSCALILWLYTFSERNFASAEAAVLRATVMLMLVSSSLFSYTWSNALENKTTGFTFRLGFVRPVSTTQLVMVPTLFCAAVAVVCFVVPAALFATLTGMALPLLGGAVGVACMVTCFVAGAWAPTTTTGKWIAIVFVGLSILILLLVFHARHNDPDPWVLAMGKPGYFEFAWYYYAGCFVVAGLASAVTIAAVDRQRHGDRWPDERLVEGSRIRAWVGRWVGASSLDSVSREPFQSRIAAQCWYEARRIGSKVLPFAILTPLFPLAFVCIGPWLYEDSMRWEGTPVVWFVALVVCPAVHQLVGTDAALGLQHKQGATQLSAFDATRSMSNDQLITIKLVVIAAYMFVGWVCMAVTASLHTTLTGTWPAWARVGEQMSAAVGDVTIAWWVAAGCSFLLFYISSTALFVAIGLWIPKHQFRCTIIIAVLFLHTMLVAWDATYGWKLRPLWLAYGYVLAVAIVLLCVFVLRRAHLEGYLSKPLFVLASCLWTIHTGLAIALYWKAAPTIASHVEVPLPVLSILMALLLAPLASTAVAPLALASHRHG